ncbi:MAG: TIGR02757 family protein [Bacteroidia bacterium]|nr:TIGR02757 family protein [Bacteroidia bacterium]
MKNTLIHEDIKLLLNEKVDQYNTQNFIASDPISIPHRYSGKEDIEIAGFLAATIAWGNRKIIVQNGHKMLDLLGESPYDFVLSHKPKDLLKLNPFVHRTFNGTDFTFFIKGLHHVYTKHGGMEALFAKHAEPNSLQVAISKFKEAFFEIPHLERTQKHISDPNKGSAAKRINMMLRWFVRNDKRGVDFGIWNKHLAPSQLSIPLDIHSGNIARKLGLLTRKQNDAQAVQELDEVLRQLDPKDPVKYDFALFGLGIFDRF